MLGAEIMVIEGYSLAYDGGEDEQNYGTDERFSGAE